MSACSASRCELTDTYSPAAIDVAPATSPATPATSTAFRDAAAAATPITRLAMDTMPSSAPSTAARSQPARPLRCGSARPSAAVALVRLMPSPHSDRGGLLPGRDGITEEPPDAFGHGHDGEDGRVAERLGEQAGVGHVEVVRQP